MVRNRGTRTGCLSRRPETETDDISQDGLHGQRPQDGHALAPPHLVCQLNWAERSGYLSGGELDQGAFVPLWGEAAIIGDRLVPVCGADVAQPGQPPPLRHPREPSPHCSWDPGHGA